MGGILSIVTCGVYPGGSDSSEQNKNDITSMQNGPTVGSVLSGVRRKLNGEQAKEKREQDVFERQTRVQQAIERREQTCTELRTRIDDHSRRALRLFAVIKDKKTTPATKTKAQEEARIALRSKQKLVGDLQKYTKVIDVARRALTVSTAVKNNEEDKTLMLDIAALTREIKLDDADITAISEAGIEVIENTDNIEQHQEDIDAAWMTLNETNTDKNSEFDLNHDDSLLSALAALEAEVQQGEQQQKPAAVANKKKQRANNDDDDNETMFETVDLTNLPVPSASLVYSGENNSPTLSVHRKVAVAETIDGQFKQSTATNSSKSRAASANKKDNLDFF